MDLKNYIRREVHKMYCQLKGNTSSGTTGSGLSQEDSNKINELIKKVETLAEKDASNISNENIQSWIQRLLKSDLSFEKDTLQTVTERGNITNRDIVFNENGSINLGSSSNKGNLWFSNSYKKDVDTNNSNVVNNVYIGYGNHNPNTLKEKHSINFGNYNSTNLEKSINNISIGYAVNYKNLQNFNSVNIGHYSSFNTKSSAFVTSIGAYSSYGISADTITKLDLVNVSPIIGNYHHLLNEGSAWLREQTDNWNYSEFVPTNFCSTFIGSYNRGLGPSVTRSCFSIHLGTRILTDFQYRDYNNIIIGNELLKNYGSIRQIHNSLIIGNFIKTNSLDNDLLIHNSKDSYTNERDVLIRGNFSERYLKINGKFIINPNYSNAQGDDTFNKTVVSKSDGTLGLIDKEISKELILKNNSEIFINKADNFVKLEDLTITVEGGKTYELEYIIYTSSPSYRLELSFSTDLDLGLQGNIFILLQGQGANRILNNIVNLEESEIKNKVSLASFIPSNISILKSIINPIQNGKISLHIKNLNEDVLNFKNIIVKLKEI